MSSGVASSIQKQYQLLSRRVRLRLLDWSPAYREGMKAPPVAGATGLESIFAGGWRVDLWRLVGAWFWGARWCGVARGFATVYIYMYRAKPLDLTGIAPP